MHLKRKIGECETMPVDVDSAIFNPARVYSMPDEILNDTKIVLSREQKIRALQTWMLDIKLRRVAEEENMHSEQDEKDVVLEDKILEALNRLGASPLPTH